MFGAKFVENTVSFGFDGKRTAEKISFGNIDGPNLTRPVIDILEEVFMDALEMIEIVVADNGRIKQLFITKLGKAAFGF